MVEINSNNRQNRSSPFFSEAFQGVPQGSQRGCINFDKASKNISGADGNKQDNQMVISGDRKQEFISMGRMKLNMMAMKFQKAGEIPAKLLIIQAKKVSQNVRQSKFNPASLSREVDGDKSTSTHISVPPPYTSSTVSETNPIWDCLPNGSDT
ncbi:hypothetical protein POM88_038491 [Heracleum sosnowskyi]|uniref:Uncharacterized protein n=1 Tax=Heracleum sosnowskyi TaxID=360622 RepID=A0AAD8H8L4_9APIA|nr:hypothetical protein POM88_038491 [Heracleum sosnowskyi]